MNIPAQTVDMFHRGRFVLVQPLVGGHRAGVDAMLLAGAVPAHFSGRLVDLGAGSGGAALAVLSRLEHVHATLVERSATMLAFAEKTKNHPHNTHLCRRIHVLDADVTWRGHRRIEAGLADNSFDFALMNPPFNEPRDRPTPDIEKAQAHVMTEGMWQDWFRTAAAIVRPGGYLALIARPLSFHDILVAIKGRFGGLILTPIFARPGDDAIRIIISAQRASRKPLAISPPLVLHGAKGHEFTARADAINNGLLSLWDKV